jgi:hypothetical protein
MLTTRPPKPLKLLLTNKLIVMQHLWRLRTLNAPYWLISSPSGLPACLPDGKFYPGQIEDLDEGDFKVSTVVRMNNCGSSRYLNTEFGSLEVQCT